MTESAKWLAADEKWRLAVFDYFLTKRARTRRVNAGAVPDPQGVWET